ncbi:hypothetical protein ABVF61_10245 [Roseibium sp. HPY-6]|uniref:hypothetical protein n=1 Tax=Roseibium sp. HPY-6 TaxID=3229852 RepID=UPI0033904D7E
MSHPNFRDEDQNEPPLDPMAERLQSKLRRLLLGSFLIMFAGLIAVFAAILYKINSGSTDVSADDFASTIVVGPEAEVLQATVSDGIVYVLVREGSKTALLRIDPSTGVEIGRTDFVAR